MYTYTCTSCIVKIRLTSLMFGQGWPPYKALPMVQGAGVTSMGTRLWDIQPYFEQVHVLGPWL